ncbi:MAG: hypothetical protein RIC55_23930 [Pirellulaceae bacterium]
MSETFDPYYKWLGIPPEEQPPDHYRLLAIRRFESDPDVIDAAAEQRMTLLRNRQSGRYAAESQKLLNELSAARGCLLDAQRRGAYDAQLQRATGEVPLAAPNIATGREPGIAPLPVAPLASPLDDLPSSDLPIVDPLATSPSPHAGYYAPPKTPTAWPMLVAVGGLGVLLVGISVLALGLGFHFLSGQSDERPSSLTSKPATSVRREETPPMPPPAVKPTPIENTPTAPVVAENTPPTSAAVDLLKQIDVDRDSVNGEFYFEDGALIVPEMRIAHLELADPPPSNYRLELLAQRLTEGGSLNVGLVCGDSEVAMVFDAFNPKVSGLNLLDRRSADRNQSTKRGTTFDDDLPHRIVCTVRPGEIHVTCDGEQLVDWQGDTSRLQFDQRFWQVRNHQRLRIVSWSSSFRILQWRLTELADE